MSCRCSRDGDVFGFDANISKVPYADGIALSSCTYINSVSYTFVQCVYSTYRKSKYCARPRRGEARRRATRALNGIIAGHYVQICPSRELKLLDPIRCEPCNAHCSRAELFVQRCDVASPYQIPLQPSRAKRVPTDICELQLQRRASDSHRTRQRNYNVLI